MKLSDFKGRHRRRRHAKSVKLNKRTPPSAPVAPCDQPASVSHRVLGGRNLLDCLVGSVFGHPRSVVGIVVVTIGCAIAINILITGTVADQLYAVIQTAVGYYLGRPKGAGTV